MVSVLFLAQNRGPTLMYTVSSQVFIGRVGKIIRGSYVLTEGHTKQIYMHVIHLAHDIIQSKINVLTGILSSVVCSYWLHHMYSP